MIFDITLLDRPALIGLANKYGVEYGKTEATAKLRARLAEIVTVNEQLEQQRLKVMRARESTPPDATDETEANTESRLAKKVRGGSYGQSVPRLAEEEVREALAPFAGRVQIMFEDDCLHVRNGDVIDCVNLHCKLNTVIAVARRVAA